MILRMFLNIIRLLNALGNPKSNVKFSICLTSKHKAIWLLISHLWLLLEATKIKFQLIFWATPILLSQGHSLLVLVNNFS